MCVCMGAWVFVHAYIRLWPHNGMRACVRVCMCARAHAIDVRLVTLECHAFWQRPLTMHHTEG